MKVLVASIVVALAVPSVWAAETRETELADLLAQNRELVQRIKSQQQQIDDLRQRLDTLNDASTRHGQDIAQLRPDTENVTRVAAPLPRSAREIRISGEAGLAYFRSGQEGAFPNSEFRVDEARLFFEAPIWKNVYFFGALELTIREANDEYFHLGEFYAEVEEMLTAGRDCTLSLRVGRFQIPFGEEYQTRYVMENPLITRSLSDIWGIDEGLQLYGTLGWFQYNVAIQNGGHKTLRDYDSDKAVVGRLSLQATPRLHLSASAMRTGDLNVAGDGLSELWFANGFFRALGTAATTRSFAVNLMELDASWTWKTGHLKAAAGRIDFDDDSPAADYSRKIDYHSIEAGQHLAGKFSGAARYSAIRAPLGYPLAGQGAAGKYFFSPLAPPTTDLRRSSLALRYQFAPPLVWKIEYSWETGRLLNGTDRDGQDLFATEIGLKF